MTGNYFTGPNMSEAAAYQLAQETAALQRAAVTNQLLNETYRNSNVRQLGNRGYDVELAGQQNRADMIRNELANRMAIADKADQLARYQWQTPSADVTQRNLTAREVAQMQIEEARLAREAQFAANYEALQAQREAAEMNYNLGLTQTFIPLTLSRPQSPEGYEMERLRYDADTKEAEAANKQLLGGILKPDNPEAYQARAISKGWLTPVKEADTDRVLGYKPAGSMAAFEWSPLSGTFTPRRPVSSFPAAMPELSNELFRRVGLNLPRTTASAQPAPGAGRTLPSGAIRLGSAALEDKRAMQGPPVPGPNAFVPAVGNPAAAPAPVNPLLLQMEMIQAGNANRPVPDYRNTLSNYLLQGAVR